MEEIYKNLSLEDLPGEIWKDIKGYEESYQVSNMGRVKSKSRYVKCGTHCFKFMKEKILKLRITNGGYLKIILHKNNYIKSMLVHRLVALNFIENPYNKKTVNHINGNKFDNIIKNLEWASYEENMLHSFSSNLRNHIGENNNRAKLSNSDVLNIKKDIVNSCKIKDLVVKYGVARSTLSDIKSGKNWSHIILD